MHSTHGCVLFEVNSSGIYAIEIGKYKLINLYIAILILFSSHTYAYAGQKIHMYFISKMSWHILNWLPENSCDPLDNGNLNLKLFVLRIESVFIAFANNYIYTQAIIHMHANTITVCIFIIITKNTQTHMDICGLALGNFFFFTSSLYCN